MLFVGYWLCRPCCDRLARDAKTGIVPFGRRVDQVMSTESYVSARRVFWVVDNGSSHRGKKAARLTRAPWNFAAAS